MSKKLRKEGRRIILALILFAIIIAAEKIFANVMPVERAWLVLYLIPYLIVGWDVVRKAFLGIIHGQMMDEALLMTIATIGAFVIGENPEACAVMLFYQIGEWFQDYAVGKSRNSITELMEIVPEEAYLVKEDGSVEEIDPEEIVIGNVLLVRPGDKLPIDGVVLEGESLLDTAALTGESVPRTAREGDQVVSGCINGDGTLKIRAEKDYEDSTVVKILELVEEASERKSVTEKFITRFARVYTPIVVIAALLLAIIPSIITHDIATWAYRACTFLVISCPCALVISVPLSFFGGIGAASKNGILVKGSSYLEQMATLTTLVSDKTGTLTQGVFKVTDVVPVQLEEAEETAVSKLLGAPLSKDLLLRLAASGESLSTHPIAKSLLEAAEGKELFPVTNAENFGGKGMAVTMADGKTLLLGSRGLFEERGLQPEAAQDIAATVVHVALENHYLGMILIADELKETAVEAIRGMKQEGVRNVVMLTGDRKEAAAWMAEKLGIDSYFAELLPADKVEKVEALLAETAKDPKKHLGFVGDGINDAPVLMRSDVGIAMGSLGSDAAIEAADVVIMDDDLKRIPLLIRIAKRTLHIAKENIIFALGVKVLVLLLAGVGIANMWWAVFADVGVAVLCILNAMRMLRTQE